jgi:hypothetical protein
MNDFTDLPVPVLAMSENSLHSAMRGLTKVAEAAAALAKPNDLDLLRDILTTEADVKSTRRKEEKPGDILKAAIDLGLVVLPRILRVKYAGWNDKARPFYVAVDLDGTLAEQMKPFDPKKIGEPRKDAKKWLDAFHKAGAKIIIFTVRGDQKLVEDWLNEHDMPFDYFNESPDQPPNSSGKVYADVYWDDRAFNAEDLDEHGPTILAKIHEHNDEESEEPDQPHITMRITHTRILLVPDDILQEITEHYDDHRDSRHET